MRTVFAMLLISNVLFASCVNQKKFKSLRIVAQEEAQVSPGLVLPFGIIAIDKNGKKVPTKGYLGGKYKISKYHVEIEHGYLMEDEKLGNIQIDSISDEELNKQIKILVWPNRKPELRDSLYVPFNYTGTVTWDFSGENGKDGDDKSARIAPIKIGGTGISTGKLGENGTSGTSGTDLIVHVRKVMDDTFFKHNGFYAYAVRASTSAGDYSRFTYIAENHGKLIIKSKGGNGGNGGDGGRGANGRDASADKTAGDGTDGGNGGEGGDGGNGGMVTVYLDSANKDFLLFFDIDNDAGKGGSPGKGGVGGAGGAGSPPNSRPGINGRNGSDGNRGRDGKNGGAATIVYRPDGW